jgi:hypothetical protein
VPQAIPTIPLIFGGYVDRNFVSTFTALPLDARDTYNVAQQLHRELHRRGSKRD